MTNMAIYQITWNTRSTDLSAFVMKVSDNPGRDLLEGVEREVDSGFVPVPGRLAQFLPQQTTDPAHMDETQRLHTHCKHR